MTTIDFMAVSATAETTSLYSTTTTIGSTVSLNTTTTPLATTSSAENACASLVNYWYVYLGAAAAMFLTGLLFSLALELIIQRLFSSTKTTSPSASEAYFVAVQHLCEELFSGQKIAGKVIMTIYFLVSIASWLGYIVSMYSVIGTTPYILAQCEPGTLYGMSVFDFVANCYFALILIIRYVASRDRIGFWFTFSTLVDCATIPSAIIAVSTTDNFFGMGFLRSIRFLNIPDILVYIHVLRGYRSIRFAQMTCKFIALWFTGAGLYALIEQFGDFWYWNASTPSVPPFGANIVSYLDGVYFSMVTMATVGYGDVTPRSVLGKVYVGLFILTAVGMFASIIPEMLTLMSHQGPDHSSYHRQPGERHVVLCGHLDYSSMKNFMHDFNSTTRLGASTKIVFLGTDRMDVKLTAFVKKHPTRCAFFQGNALNAADLERARVASAECVIILCNLNAKQPVEEDTRTLMRVIAVKDYCPGVRCIIQLIQYQSKAKLKSIPRWRRNIDSCICISELKLGLIAQNCVAPGFCVLLTNLITFSRKDSDGSKLLSWKRQYLEGVRYELYYVRFSDAFNGLLFCEAVELCFVRLGVILVAIDCLDFRQQSMAICINPHDTVTINPTTMCAFVIAHSEEHAQQVARYCLSCHGFGNTQKRCHCSNSAQAQRIRRNAATAKLSQNDEPQVLSTNSNMNQITLQEVDETSEDGLVNSRYDNKSNRNSVIEIPRHRNAVTLRSRSFDINSTRRHTIESVSFSQFDVTGLFHWTPTQQLSKVTLTRETAEARRFINHIVVCLFAYKDSPVLGLCNFVMPLRSSSIQREDLRDIVIICNGSYIEKEWNALQNFPNIFVLPGSPLNRADLRSVNLWRCSSCVILSATKTFQEGLDDCLMDKEAVLCTANIKAMPKSSHAMHVKNSKDRGFGKSDDVIGDHLNLFTELSNVNNGTFLGRSDAYQVKQDAFLLEGYACGRMFNVSVLDSLVTTTYFSRNTLTFIQAMITGGSSDELELIFAEDIGLPPGISKRDDEKQKQKAKSVWRVRRMSVSSPPLSYCCTKDENVPFTFRQLFLNALREYGIICIGLYRKVDLDDTHHDCKRYVITAPKREFMIDESDLIFVIQSEKSVMKS